MVEAFPQGVIDAVKQALGGWVPRPPQVIGQLAQPVDAARQVEMVWDFCAKFRHVLFSKAANHTKELSLPGLIIIEL